MPINLDRVRRAKGMIDARPEAPQLRTEFHALRSDLFIVRQLVHGAEAEGRDATEERKREHPHLRGHAQIVDERVGELVTVGHKLQWQLTQHIEQRLPWDVYVHYASLDVVVFFMLLRSALDHSAGIIQHVVTAPKGQRKRFSSFHELHGFAGTSRGRQYLGDVVSDLVVSCDWFEDVRGWRDAIVHEGSHLLVTNDGPRPVFLIAHGTTFEMNIPEVMCSTNVVDYWHFAGLYLAYLICFLDDLALLVRGMLPTVTFGANPSMQHPGLVFLHEAMNELAPQ